MSFTAAEEVRRKNHVILGHVRREIDEDYHPQIIRAEHLRMMSRSLPGVVDTFDAGE